MCDFFCIELGLCGLARSAYLLPKTVRLPDPVSNENVRFVRLPVVPIGGKDQLFAVMAEHREAVESGVIRHSLNLARLDIDQVEIKVSSFRGIHI